MTRVIFTLASTGVVIMTGVVFVVALVGEGDAGAVTLTLTIDSLVALGWVLIARGRWQASAALLPLASLAIAGYMIFTAGPVTTGVLQLVMAVLVAGMLSGNRARWVMVVLASLVYLVAGRANGGLDLETFATSGTLLIVTLAVVALLERFFTDELDKTLFEVREREAELESIFRAAPVGIGMAVGRVIQIANPSLCQMTGYSREELLGQSLDKLCPAPEEFDAAREESLDQIREVGQASIETRWLRKDGAMRDILLNAVPLDPSDLTKGVTFSVMDLTDRKQAHRVLQTSQDLLRESQKIARMGYYLIDMPSGLGEISEGLAELFGIDATPQVNVTNWINLVHPADREAMLSYFKEEVLEKRQDFDREFKILRGYDGATRWMHGLGRLEFDEAGKLSRMIGNIQDITERKRAEQALYESEERYRQAVENSPNPIFSVDLQGKIRLWNRACEKSFHYSQDIIGKPYHILLQDAEAHSLVQGMLDELGCDQSLSNVDMVYRCQDREERFMVSRIYPLCSHQGEVQGHVFANTDVTQRRTAEQALRKSEEQYRLLFNEMISGFALHEILCDQDGKPVDYRFLAVNKAFEQLTGMKADDLIGRTVLEAMPGIEPFWIERYGRVALEGAADQFDGYNAILGKHYEVRAFCPEPGKFAVMFHDVTERKKAEEEVRKSKQALEKAERLVHLGHYEIDTATGQAVWSDEVFNIFGLDPCGSEPALEDYLALVHAEDRSEVLRLYEESIQKRAPFDFVYRIIRKDGSVRYVRSYASVIKDAEGKAKLFGTFQDVTELKRVELALQESQALYHDLVETAQDLVWQCDREGRYTYLNPAWTEVFGYELHEMLGKPFTAFQSPEHARKDSETFLRVLDGNSVARYQTVYLAKDGRQLQLVFNAKVVRDCQGNIIGTRGTAYDISEHKQAEAQLRESAARYRAVVENQTEFIVRWKPDGTRTFANEAYLRYFGLSMEEALSSAFMPLIAEEDRIAVEQKVSRLLGGAAQSETDVHKVIKPDGSIGWQEWTDYAIHNGQGEVVEFQSIGRDVTERRLADEALQAKTRELEALFSISSHLRAAQSADEMLPLVLEEMRRVLHSDANAVILLASDRQHFKYALSDGALKANDGLQFGMENSISGLVLQTRQPYITDNLSSDPKKASGVTGDDGLGPATVVPVVSESEFLGVLLCARNKDGASQRFTSSEVRLLTAIGEMVGNALRRARLYDQALKRMQHLQTLHSIDTAISANLDLNVILEVLLTQGIPQLDVDAACVMLLDPHTHMLGYAAGKGFRGKQINSARLRLGEGLPGKVALERQTLYIPNLSKTDSLLRKYLLDEGFISYQAAPLVAKGQLQGVLETFTRRSLEVSEEQTGFLETLAIQAAIAIDNSQLFSELQRSNFELEMAYDATIEGWSRALELRDQETEGHTLRVTDMTLQLAQAIGVKGADLIHLRRGALLHDIGKMGIPDQILLKPGKLTDEERQIMKQHTVYAFEMLRPIDFLRPAIDIPYCHHERWDGTGYPRQLKGEQIPLSARLFAVADVWDALTSDRPYRKAWSEEKALDYITGNKSRHFDPKVVEVFLRLRGKKGVGWGSD